MKKGQIVNIRRHLPKNDVFSSYKDVKKYWKNMARKRTRFIVFEKK